MNLDKNKKGSVFKTIRDIMLFQLKGQPSRSAREKTTLRSGMAKIMLDVQAEQTLADLANQLRQAQETFQTENTKFSFLEEQENRVAEAAQKGTITPLIDPITEMQIVDPCIIVHDASRSRYIFDRTTLVRIVELTGKDPFTQETMTKANIQPAGKGDMDKAENARVEPNHSLKI